MQHNKLIRNGRIIGLAAALIAALNITSCGNSTVKGGDSLSLTEAVNTQAQKKESVAQIYLYGEQHAKSVVMDKESELWHDYYHNEGLRHLFIEVPYYTAEFLNLWMKSDNDEILNAVYDDWQGTAAYNPYTKAFYQRIKSECPETVFHGADVGHQYDTTGERFLNYLQENHLEDSEQFQLAQDAVQQGKYYYEHSDDAYRENKMAQNFARELDALGGESVMGIFGAAHTEIEETDYSTHSVPSMANQLYASYGDSLHTEDLTLLAKDIEPEQVETITIAGKEYQASYFGKEDLTGFKDFVYRKFWRLENAYEDFKDRPRTGDVLPYDNYPMLIEKGQVFAVEYEKTDGSILRHYYRSDGNTWEGLPTTDGFQY